MLRLGAPCGGGGGTDPRRNRAEKGVGRGIRPAEVDVPPLREAEANSPQVCNHLKRKPRSGIKYKLACSVKWLRSGAVPSSTRTSQLANHGLAQVQHDANAGRRRRSSVFAHGGGDGGGGVGGGDDGGGGGVGPLFCSSHCGGERGGSSYLVQHFDMQPDQLL
jgi:hypothetical protein